MKDLRLILNRVLRAAPWLMAGGAALALLVLIFGISLLGVSGWFITATGIAGLAGAGIAFDVFRPSASIRFFALGRTAARYGERVLTHEAVLHALARLRGDLLAGLSARPAREVEAMRSEAALTRITADVDALDGLVLRLLLPICAGLAAHMLAGLALWGIVGAPMALAVAAGYVPGAALALIRLGRLAPANAIRAEAATQSLRRDMIAGLRDRAALIVAGLLPARRAALLAQDRAARSAAASLDRAERDARAVLSLLPGLAAALALLTGGWMIGQGAVGPAPAAIGFFVALGLGETLLALPRGLAELGRMRDAASRVAPLLRDAAPHVPATPLKRAQTGPVLQAEKPELLLKAGDRVALTGPSGSGKTTFLWQAAGLLPPDAPILLWGTPVQQWPETDLRTRLTLVPQRAALVAGTVAENLALSGCLDRAEMERALDAVGLTEVFQARQSLETRLAEGGTGLSGGQARRLAIARAILRRPDLLLLDEPTEGLDDASAARMLSGLHRALPDAAILCAMHRHADDPVFGRIVAFNMRDW
ncbi:amino acid ABC transporter ATP-binding/permease protein [Paracoccus xiamenensis]|uniref:amino acid ABC transporter ATP-binding/permease protein n=1 Tax=Paracoccus xiamenensis TaxID=2714901 RepID=UPI00140A8532|nr:ATP-binding cassette domain-containing protein [Paracoccus xiamenensis]NHF72713.1 ATP-binding cassette domain-containing protein [Paracoccus xiamenensis]